MFAAQKQFESSSTPNGHDVPSNAHILAHSVTLRPPKTTRVNLRRQRQTQQKLKAVTEATAEVLPHASSVDEEKLLERIAEQFRKRYFDAWATELRSQRPFVNDQGNMEKLRQDLRCSLFEDLKCDMFKELEQRDAAFAHSLEQIHQFNFLTREETLQTQEVVQGVDHRMDELQDQVFECQQKYEALSTQLHAQKQQMEEEDRNKRLQSLEKTKSTLLEARKEQEGHVRDTVVKLLSMTDTPNDTDLYSALQTRVEESLKEKLAVGLNASMNSYLNDNLVPYVQNECAVCKKTTVRECKRTLAKLLQTTQNREQTIEKDKVRSNAHEENCSCASKTSCSEEVLDMEAETVMPKDGEAEKNDEDTAKPAGQDCSNSNDDEKGKDDVSGDEKETKGSLSVDLNRKIRQNESGGASSSDQSESDDSDISRDFEREPYVQPPPMFSFNAQTMAETMAETDDDDDDDDDNREEFGDLITEQSVRDGAMTSLARANIVPSSSEPPDSSCASSFSFETMQISTSSSSLISTARTEELDSKKKENDRSFQQKTAPYWQKNKQEIVSAAKRIESSALRPSVKSSFGMSQLGRVKKEQFKPRRRF